MQLHLTNWNLRVLKILKKWPKYAKSQRDHKKVRIFSKRSVSVIKRKPWLGSDFVRPFRKQTFFEFEEKFEKFEKSVKKFELIDNYSAIVLSDWTLCEPV